VTQRQIFHPFFWQNLSVEKLFLYFGIIFGCLFILISPPFHVPDEGSHFFRAYEISDGKIISIKIDNKGGNYLPVSLKKTADSIFLSKRLLESLKKETETSLNQNDRSFIEFAGTFRYSPIPYIPQIIGITIGKILNLAPLFLLYLGRIFNFLFWLVLTYFAIKIIPIGKLFFFIYAFTPMSLYLASSLSADALTNSLSMLSISVMLSYILNNKTLHNRNIALLLILFSLFALCKPTYVIITFLIIFIPRRNIKMNLFLFYSIMFLIPISLSIAWSYVIRDIAAVSSGLPKSETMGQQLNFAMHNPVFFFQAIVNTIKYYFLEWYLWGFYGIFGFFSSYLPLKLAFLHIIVLISALIIENNNKIICFPFRTFLVVIFIVNLTLILSGVYLTWTPLKSTIILGFQGRYLIPILSIFLLAFYLNKQDKQNNQFVVFAYFFLALSCSILYIFSSNFFSFIFLLPLIGQFYYSKTEDLSKNKKTLYLSLVIFVSVLSIFFVNPNYSIILKVSDKITIPAINIIIFLIFIGKKHLIKISNKQHLFRIALMFYVGFICCVSIYKIITSFY